MAAHRSHNFVTDRRDYCPTPKDIVTEAPSAISRPLEGMLDAREIVTLLRRVRYLGRITGSRLALLVPRNVALDELNIYRFTTGGDLDRALSAFEIEDYPQRAPKQQPDLPQRLESSNSPLHGSNPDGSTPGALHGDDYQLDYYDDGYPRLPAFLDRRKPKVAEAA